MESSILASLPVSVSENFETPLQPPAGADGSGITVVLLQERLLFGRCFIQFLTWQDVLRNAWFPTVLSSSSDLLRMQQP